jgi:ferredoxin
MSNQEPPLHYVCTRQQAQKIVAGQDRFWVSDCGCRVSRGKCERSRIDVCLEFLPQTAAEGSGRKEVTRDAVEAIIREAEDKHLVTRPFRDQATKTKTEGICFCCDDCCGYFIDPGGYVCDKGEMVESTDMDKCTHCGLCADVCYFGARKMVGGELVLHSENCYGCGLCTDVCPEACTKMVPRPAPHARDR